MANLPKFPNVTAFVEAATERMEAMSSPDPDATYPDFAGTYNVQFLEFNCRTKWNLNAEGRQSSVVSDLPVPSLDLSSVPSLYGGVLSSANAYLSDLSSKLPNILSSSIVIYHHDPWLVRVANNGQKNVHFIGLNDPEGFTLDPSEVSMDILMEYIDGLQSIQVVGLWNGANRIGGRLLITSLFSESRPRSGVGIELSIAARYRAIRS